MIEVRQTAQYSEWISGLRDRAAVVRIALRIRRLQEGNPGQHRTLTGGVAEMKIDHGPGYRIYYTRRGARLVILLAGGTKQGQQADIDLALRLAKEVEA